MEAMLKWSHIASVENIFNECLCFWFFAEKLWMLQEPCGSRLKTLFFSLFSFFLKNLHITQLWQCSLDQNQNQLQNTSLPFFVKEDCLFYQEVCLLAPEISLEWQSWDGPTVLNVHMSKATLEGRRKGEVFSPYSRYII